MGTYSREELEDLLRGVGAVTHSDLSDLNGRVGHVEVGLQNVRLQ